MNKKRKKPLIFILSGPGGSGKTTLLKRLFRKNFIKKNFLKTISFTTRERRRKEKEAKDYFFVDKNEFLKLKRKGLLLESQKVLSDYYGTPKCFYRQAKKEKKSLILCIDVKGGIYLKKNLKLGKIITIFITASNRELCQRLKKRAESKTTIKRRLTLAEKEISVAQRYDYLVTNRKIKVTLKNLEAIFLKETRRRKK